jgi:mlo protein
MLLGFIPLLLAGFQGKIERICIPAGWIHHMLPCRRADETAGKVGATNKHFVDSEIGKRLLSEAGAGAAHCQSKVIRPFN